MPGLSKFIASQKRLGQQQRELKRLRREVASLQAQNDSMRDGMRRCVTCEYRIDFKNRQGPDPGDNINDN